MEEIEEKTSLYRLDGPVLNESQQAQMETGTGIEYLRGWIKILRGLFM